MKTTVNRVLQAGVYNVNFSFAEFTDVELDKMRSFGVPVIQVQYTISGARRLANLPINQINTNYNAGFDTEEEAKAYEQSVLNQVRTAMEALRHRKDDFTSSEEVSI